MDETGKKFDKLEANGENSSKEFIEEIKLDILESIKDNAYNAYNEFYLVKLIKEYTHMYVDKSDKESMQEYINYVKSCVESLHYGGRKQDLIKYIGKYIDRNNKESIQEYINYVKSCVEEFDNEAYKQELIKYIGKYIDRDNKESIQEYINYLKNCVEELDDEDYEQDIIEYIGEYIDGDNKEFIQEYIDYVKSYVENLDDEYYEGELVKYIGKYIDRNNKESIQEYIDYVKSYVENLYDGDCRQELIMHIGEYIDKDNKGSIQEYIDYLKSYVKEFEGIDNKLNLIYFIGNYIDQKDKNSVQKYMEYLKSCLKDVYLYEDYKLELVNYIVEFGKSEDEEGIEHYINNVKNILEDEELKDYINSLKLIKLPFKYIVDNQKDFVKYIEFVKECFLKKNINLSNTDKYYIINNISLHMNNKNTENVREYVNFLKDSIRNKELMLDSNTKSYLIALIGSFVEHESDDIKNKYVDYIKKCIDDKSLGLNDESKNYLIRRLERYYKSDEQVKYIKFIEKYLQKNSASIKNDCKLDLLGHMSNFLRNKDTNSVIEYLNFLKNYGLSECAEFDYYQKNRLVSNIKNYIETEKVKYKAWEVIQAIFPEKEDAIKSLVSWMKGEQLEESNFTDSEMKIDLPEGMTIGIEIESEGFIGEFVRGNLLGWEAKEDGSIDGVEVVSPRLVGSEKDSQQIFQICNILKNIGQKVTQVCGGHIHIGADYLTSNEAYLILLELWSNAEKVLYQISNNAGELTRENALDTYAPPISKKIEEALEEGYVDLSVEDSFDYFVYDLETIQENDRYSGINFLNVGSDVKNTIEFRLSNGTLDAKTWIENINLFGRYNKGSTRVVRNI